MYLSLFIFALCASIPFGHVRAQTITILDEMSFGEFIADPIGDEIRIRPNGRITAQNGSDLRGGESRARFRIFGDPNQSVIYSFSSGNTLSNGSTSISLNTFQGGPVSPIALNGNGRRNLRVGARLTIPPNLESGTYTGTYVLTVDNQ